MKCVINILKNLFSIFLIIFGIYVISLNELFFVLFGMSFIFLGFLFSIAFDFICKFLNKKVSFLRKLAITYGTLMIPYLTSYICNLVIEGYYQEDNASNILIINILLILVYWLLFIFINRNKYESVIKTDIKRIIIIIVTLILINIPYLYVKYICISNYNDLYDRVNIVFEDDLYINIFDLNISEYDRYNNLSYKRDYRFENINNSYEKMIVLRNDEGVPEKVVSFSNDVFSGALNAINDEPFNIQKYYMNKYKIDSYTGVYDNYNRIGKPDIFDSINNLYYSLNYSPVALCMDCSVSKVNNNKGYKIYYIEHKDQDNHKDVLIKNGDVAYKLSFSKYNKSEVLEFVSTLKIN